MDAVQRVVAALRAQAAEELQRSRDARDEVGDRVAYGIARALDRVADDLERSGD